jgi:predicted O-methyltransferase YrrM
MKYIKIDIESSYQVNDLGKTLYDLVLRIKPKKIIEFGTLHGYSAVAMSMALDELQSGHLTSYDLWDKYPYKHGKMEEVLNQLKRYKVDKYVTLADADLKVWLDNPEPFDLMHVDVSNNGETIDLLYEKLKNNIKNDSLVIFEGGSKERDDVEWVKKYNKKPIAKSFAPYEIIDDRFPSISKLIF